MNEIPSLLLLLGDLYASKNNIVAAKKKYINYEWITVSASDCLNKIQREIRTETWNGKKKIVVIEDIPNKKSVRDFLIKTCAFCPNFTKLILWDSNNHIKVDPKTKTYEKTWLEFINDFKQIKGKVIINGELNEKDEGGVIDFVISAFAKSNIIINDRDAKLLISIVGYDRGMLDTDIKKMCLICPDKVDSQFIIDNAFPTTKESILYKISNVLDDGSYEDCINVIDRFLASGINENVIAEIIVKKARWQMVAAYLWSVGLSWNEIANKLMEMGKFPSQIWHDFQGNTLIKKRDAETYQSTAGIIDFLTRKQGIPKKYLKLKVVDDKKTTLTRKGSETIPLYFMATQVVDFVRDKIVKGNKSTDFIKKIVDRSIYVYLFVQEKLAQIRYGDNPTQDLQEMIRAITNINLNC